MGRYHLKLYTADPGSSEIIGRLAGLLSSFVYLVAIYGAFLTLATALVGLLAQFSIIVIPFLWIPIIAMFVLNQSSLSNIIRTAKWKTLKEIPARVERLHLAENLGEKETMEAVNRLMDYHDRVNRTRNSAIDLSTTLSFINSLLLPLLAFILGNLDLVLNLFARKP